MSSNLFSPISVGEITLNQRVAMAPLTRLRNENQVPPKEAVEYYGDRGAAAAGTLIIGEATTIAAKAGGYFYAPGLWSKEQIESWSKITAQVHKGGSFMFAQLWSHGRGANEADLKKMAPEADVVSASDIAITTMPGMGFVKPRPLTIPEIKEYVDLYVQAAKNALEAGFDGVEVNAANGFLLNQFLHEDVNRRTDEYGGSIENRSRFFLEIVDAVVDAIGASKVGVRFNPFGGFQEMDYKISPLPQYTHVLSELERRAQENEANRLAYVHVMEPRVDFFAGSYGTVDRDANAYVRQIWKGVIIRCGSFGMDKKLMQELTGADDKLILAVGRLFISNPDFIVKLRDDIPVDMFDRDTFYWANSDKFPLPVGYTKDYIRK